ncbi:MAG TPA: cation-translocating P-type ATPase, partial [Syntrophomonadaceae bacterium]|nr:cation-translocating P-type ATPase [Syntrophomonadaceae bacterium]
ADCRLISCSNLEVKEDMLTGESQTVCKQCLPRKAQPLSLAEQDNMVFMGTYVIRGRAQAVVVGTGNETEIGRIATMLDDLNVENTPLQKQLNQLGKDLSYICLIVCAGISIFGILRGQAVFNMLRTGISLAVGAIPEGLPVFVTISMAFGVQRMARKNAVVRRLPVVETLSYATVICSDKTGTLTTNEMTVTELYVDDRSINITGKGYTPSGSFLEREELIQADQDDSLLKLLLIGTLCNNAHLFYEEQDQKWQVLGDPTEAALLVLAKKAGIDQGRLEQMMKKEMEVPFESDTRLMAVVLRTEKDGRILFVKGAPEKVLEHCSLEYRQQEEKILTIRRRNQIIAAGEDMASRALRVIGTAYKVLEDDAVEPALLFTDLVFAGLAGMMDPPRLEVKNALEKCKQAGIKTTMITGDQKLTALAVARELDMLGQGLQLSGNEIDAMSDEELAVSIKEVELIYRASPSQKLRIVRAYKEQGFVVVMTGDGVNDAPAVKEAHVGISMGRGGTDVTREASGITLTDDSFATIVTAVEEGRTIRANIRNFIRYVLSGNLGEIIAVAGCSLLGMPVPLEPGHILWVNLATEGIPALALGMDQPHPACMRRPPENPDQKILDDYLTKNILTRGSVVGATTIGMMAYGLLTGPGNLSRARTMALSNIISCQMFNAFDSRCLRNENNHNSMPKNPYLLPSVLMSSGLMLGIMYIPWLRGIFSTFPLGVRDWMTVLFSSGMVSRLDRFVGINRLNDTKLPVPVEDSLTTINLNKTYLSIPGEIEIKSPLAAFES